LHLDRFEEFEGFLLGLFLGGLFGGPSFLLS
jgi:hypothetical protein